MRVILFCLALLSSLTCFGQYQPLGAISMWADGYVVTAENDTISGRVRVGSTINDSPAGIVVETADGKKVKIKGETLRVLAQRIPDFAYSTGSIPRSRDMIVFERVPNPRRNGKLMLLERLTPPGGRVALYFDVSGWKRTVEYSFGNFTLGTNPQDLSYVIVKDNQESLIAKRGDVETIHEKFFGDCPAFIRQYPSAMPRMWNRFGEMVDAYNHLCLQQ